MPSKILPPKDELQKLIERGLTHQQIADLISQQTGYDVKRSTVSAAIHRAGLSGRAKKYAEEIPWTVREQHLTHYAARMLRLLGRRRRGIQNSQEADERLDAWLKLLRDNKAVVTYQADSPDGFYYIPGRFTRKGLPIKELEL